MMDYALPRAEMLTSYETDRTETPTPVNPLGVKGAGETGTIASTPAVVNAVVDALAGTGRGPHRSDAAHIRARLEDHPGRQSRRSKGDARMYPAQFDYHTPGTIKEALDLLGKHKDDAKLLAGGHSLLPAMKLRLAQPKHLVDLRKISGLSGIKEEGGTLVIGAMATHHAVESSAVVKSKCPCSRRRPPRSATPWCATWGRSAAAWPTRIPPPTIPRPHRAGRRVGRRGAEGQADHQGRRLLQGALTTALGEDEILTEVRVPALAAERVGAAYMKFPHPASRFAVVGVAAVLTIDGGKCHQG